MKQSKYTKSARGQECQVRIPGICNGDNQTVVLAHLNGGGIGTKHLDIHGSYSCSNCHDAIDGRIKTYLNKEKRDLYHLEGVIRTQQIMIKEGILII